MQTKNDEIDSVEELQTSLIQLTTHFAQVQFQLRQIVNAPAEKQENLLRKLEKFAFSDLNLLESNSVDDDLLNEIKEKHNKQKLLIKKLKCQIKEVKILGDLAEKQKLITKKPDPDLSLKKQIADLQKQIFILNQEQKVRRSLLDLFLEKTFTFLLPLMQFSPIDCCRNKTITNHWGSLHAQIELAIIELEDLLKKPKKSEILYFVRNNLTTAIKNLVQHGTSQPIHAWEVVLKFYQINNGKAYSSNSKLKLSQSFKLNLPYVNTARAHLYYAIEDITSSLSRYKRSYNAHFKALICAGLNTKKLTVWLNLIFHCSDLVKEYYEAWSYVANTRFRNCLANLEVLKKYDFELPVDLDVRRFQTADEIFA